MCNAFLLLFCLGVQCWEWVTGVFYYSSFVIHFPFRSINIFLLYIVASVLSGYLFVISISFSYINILSFCNDLILSHIFRFKFCFVWCKYNYLSFDFHLDGMSFSLQSMCILRGNTGLLLQGTFSKVARYILNIKKSVVSIQTINISRN